jgi:hypothetical protein
VPPFRVFQSLFHVGRWSFPSALRSLSMTAVFRLSSSTLTSRAYPKPEVRSFFCAGETEE